MMNYGEWRGVTPAIDDTRRLNYRTPTIEVGRLAPLRVLVKATSGGIPRDADVPVATRHQVDTAHVVFIEFKVLRLEL